MPQRRRGSARPNSWGIPAPNKAANTVDDAEQHVSDLVLDRVGVAVRQGLVELTELFTQFLARPTRVRPIEAGARGLLADAMSAEQGG